MVISEIGVIAYRGIGQHEDSLTRLQAECSAQEGTHTQPNLSANTRRQKTEAKADTSGDPVAPSRIVGEQWLKRIERVVRLAVVVQDHARLPRPALDSGTIDRLDMVRIHDDLVDGNEANEFTARCHAPAQRTQQVYRPVHVLENMAAKDDIVLLRQ